MAAKTIQELEEVKAIRKRIDDDWTEAHRAHHFDLLTPKQSSAFEDFYGQLMKKAMNRSFPKPGELGMIEWKLEILSAALEQFRNLKKRGY